MIITDKFVFLHFPKAGGSFISEVLKKVHAQIEGKNGSAPMCKELMMPNIKRICGAKVYNPHGIYDQIPDEYKNKPIISSIRNPFDYYVSIYEFRSWIKRQPEELEKIKKQFPGFPELSFKEYLTFVNVFNIENRAHCDQLKLDIGVMTYAFLQFFFKDTGRIIENLDEAYLNSDQYKKDMPEITFLRTENLNLDLYNTLLKFGYPKKEISFIVDEAKVNITPQRKTKNWLEYYDEDLYNYVKFKERYILKLFPEYNFDTLEKNREVLLANREIEKKNNEVFLKIKPLGGFVKRKTLRLTKKLKDVFRKNQKPKVSIIIPQGNDINKTYDCLKSISSNTKNENYEIIMVTNDCSSNKTQSIPTKIKGIRILRKKTDWGFLNSCNYAAEQARGNFLVFLNDNTTVKPSWLYWLLNTLETIWDAGLVSSKFIFSNNNKEGKKGSVYNYGLLDDPDLTQYSFLKEVDNCSGACIMIPRDLFFTLGKFDCHYSGIYFEDTNLAFKVKSAEKKVFYQPHSIVVSTGDLRVGAPQ